MSLRSAHIRFIRRELSILLQLLLIVVYCLSQAELIDSEYEAVHPAHHAEASVTAAGHALETDKELGQLAATYVEPSPLLMFQTVQPERAHYGAHMRPVERIRDKSPPIICSPHGAPRA